MLVDIPKHSLPEVIEVLSLPLDGGKERSSKALLHELTESTDRMALLLLDEMSERMGIRDSLLHLKDVAGSNYFLISSGFRKTLFMLSYYTYSSEDERKLLLDVSALLYAYSILTVLTPTNENTDSGGTSKVTALMLAVLASQMSGSGSFLACFYEFIFPSKLPKYVPCPLEWQASISSIQVSTYFFFQHVRPCSNKYVPQVPRSVSSCIGILTSTYNALTTLQAKQSLALSQLSPTELCDRVLGVLPSPSLVALKLLLDTYLGWLIVDGKTPPSDAFLWFCLTLYREATQRSFVTMDNDFASLYLLYFLVPVLMVAHCSLQVCIGQVYLAPSDLLLQVFRRFTTMVLNVHVVNCTSTVPQEPGEDTSPKLIDVSPIFISVLLLTDKDASAVSDTSTSAALFRTVYGVVLYLLYALVDWDTIADLEATSLDASTNLTSLRTLKIRPLDNKTMAELYSQLVRLYLWTWHVHIKSGEDEYQLIDVDLPNTDYRYSKHTRRFPDDAQDYETYMTWLAKTPIVSDLLALRAPKTGVARTVKPPWDEPLMRTDLDLMAGIQLGLLVLRTSLEATLAPLLPSFKYYTRQANTLRKSNQALLRHLRLNAPRARFDIDKS